MSGFRLFVHFVWAVVMIEGAVDSNLNSQVKQDGGSMETVEEVLGLIEDQGPLADQDMQPHRMAYRTLKVARNIQARANAAAPKAPDAAKPKA